MSLPIVIFFESDKPTDFPMSESVYKDSYEMLFSMACERGIDLRFVFGTSSYNSGYFNSYWTFKDKELTQHKKVFKAKKVYIKSRTHIMDQENRVNSKAMEIICRDKLLTAQAFPELVKPTSLVSETTLPAIHQLQSELVVLKPRYGGGGRDIRIVKKNTIDKAYMESLKEEYVAQELIESSSGMPPFTSQRHELRLFVFNGVIGSAYIRLPAQDSYLANISQGATVLLIDTRKIPESVHAVRNKVDTAFKDSADRLYTIDIMMENGKPWIVELNDQPGVPDITVQPLTTDYHNCLLDLLSV